MKEGLLRAMHEEARSIFHHALCSSSIAAAFDRRFPAAFPFAKYDRIYAIALGKAALPMLESLCARLPRALDGGVCCARYCPRSGNLGWSISSAAILYPMRIPSLPPGLRCAGCGKWASGTSSSS